MAKEKGNKKKLSAKAFTAIVAPLLAVLLAFSIVLSVVSTSRFDPVSYTHLTLPTILLV